MMVEDFSIIAGLPRALCARGTEPHTHKLWSTSSYGCHVIDRAYVRVYGLYGWGTGDYQKEGRGVSGASCQVHIFTLHIYNMVN